MLHGSSGSMMAHLFGQFNFGVIVIAAFVLGYGVVQNVLRTISETAFMSANRNTATMVLRIALGFSVLIPLGSYTNGYNASQVLLMEVVKSGVSLADVTWDATLKTWKNQQGQILQQPAVSTKNKDKILNKNFTDKLLTVDQPYLASEIDSDLNTYNSNIKLGDDSASGLKTISDGDLTGLSFLQKMFEVNVCLYKRRLDTSNFALTSSYSSGKKKNQLPPVLRLIVMAVGLLMFLTWLRSCTAITPGIRKNKIFISRRRCLLLTNYQVTLLKLHKLMFVH